MTLDEAPPKLTNRLSPWSVLLLIIAASLVVFWPTWLVLHEFWISSTRYSHGHLVVAMSGYLVFRQRDHLRSAAMMPTFAGFLPLALGLTAWAVAVISGFQAIHEILLPALIWLICLTMLGWGAARLVLLPIAFLYLAVPIWESGNFVLQYVTVIVNELLLRLIQVPAFIEGNIVHLSAGSFSIDGGCSGLHYFLISIAISVFYGALFIDSRPKRLLLVALSMGLALLTNWLRVFIVIVAGYLTDMQHYLVVHDHYYFGWFLYVFAMIPFVIIARRLENQNASVPGRETDYPILANERSGAMFSGAAAMCCVLLVGAAAVVHARTAPNENFEGVLSVAQAEGEWQSGDQSRVDWRPVFKGADAEVLSVYEGPSGTVALYVNLYRGQAQAKEVVGYENRLEGEVGWTPSVSRIREVTARSEKKWQVREMILTAPGGLHRLLYYWYFVGDRHLTQPYLTKLYYGFDAIAEVPDAGIQIVSTACDEACDEGRALLDSWLAVYLPDGPGRLFDIQE